MPESPEVESLVGFLDARAAGRSIRDIDVLEFRTVKTRAAPPARLAGQRITGATRHGKHVELLLEQDRLIVSLGRHGWVRWRERGEGAAFEASAADAPPALAVLTLDDGSAMEVTDAGTWVSLGLWVVDGLHVVDPESLERLAHASLTWHGDPPKLAAVG